MLTTSVVCSLVCSALIFKRRKHGFIRCRNPSYIIVQNMGSMISSIFLALCILVLLPSLPLPLPPHSSATLILLCEKNVNRIHDLQRYWATTSLQLLFVLCWSHCRIFSLCCPSTIEIMGILVFHPLGSRNNIT